MIYLAIFHHSSIQITLSGTDSTILKQDSIN